MAWTLVGIGYVTAFMAPTEWLPSNTPALRRFQTPEVRAGIEIAQTFVMPADGFHAIEFRAAPAGPDASGDVRVTLVDATGHEYRPVHVFDVPAAELTRASSYRLEFPPMHGSRNTPFRLEFTSSSSRAGDGVTLLATRGRGYGGGTLEINGVPRWADLAFRTYAPVPARWRLLLSNGNGWLVLAGLGVTWALLGFVFRGIARLAQEQDQDLTKPGG